MTHENEPSSLGEIVLSAMTRGEQRASMTLAEMQAFDKDCARYDFEVKEAKSSLLRMISIMPAPGTEQDPETRAAVYWDVLKNELSPDAIARVCRKALAGDIGSPKWLPMPGELIRFAKNNWIQCGPVEVDPRCGPAIQLTAPEHKLLEFRDYGGVQFKADERARIGLQMHALAGELARTGKDIEAHEKPDYTRRGPPVYSRQEIRLMDVGEREKQRIEAEAYLDSIRNKPPPVLSPELLAKLGVGKKQVAAE